MMDHCDVTGGGGSYQKTRYYAHLQRGKGGGRGATLRSSAEDRVMQLRRFCMHHIMTILQDRGLLLPIDTPGYAMI